MENWRKDHIKLLYITGEVHFEDVKKEVELIGNPKNVVIKPFIHNMPEVLAGIDLTFQEQEQRP